MSDYDWNLEPTWPNSSDVLMKLRQTEADNERLRLELAASEAEVDRLTRDVCSCLLRDGRGGRVGVPNVVRALVGVALGWRSA